VWVFFCPLACFSWSFCSPRPVSGCGCCPPSYWDYGVCLFVLLLLFSSLFCQIHFILSRLWEWLSFVFLRPSFELNLLGYAGILATQAPRSCSSLASDPAASTTGSVEPPCSERGLHPSRVWLAHEGHAPLFQLAEWYFWEGMLTDCSRGGLGVARVLHTSVSRWFLHLSA